MIAALLCLAALPAQDGEAAEVARQIERLGSDAIDEREDAAEKLKGLGAAAVPELEKLTGSSDADLAERSKRLLPVIRIRISLGPALLKAIPGADERLARGGAHAWTEVLLETLDPRKGLGRQDRQALILPALRGASTEEERERICGLVGSERHREALPEVVKLLDGDGWSAFATAVRVLGEMGQPEDVVPRLIVQVMEGKTGLRERAAWALGKLPAGAVVPRAAALLRNADPFVRHAALEVLSELRAKEAVHEFVLRLRDESASVRARALRGLACLDARESQGEIRPLLRDVEPSVRAAAARALGALGAKEAAREIAPLLKEGDAEVRREAVVALGRLGARESAPRIAELLDAGDPGVRMAGLEALAALGAREAVRKIADLLKDEHASIRAAAAEALQRLGAGD